MQGRKFVAETPPRRENTRRTRSIIDLESATFNLSIPSRIFLWLDRHGKLRRLVGSEVEVTTVDVPIRDLPEALDGFLIVHLSDLHVGEGRWATVHGGEVGHLVHDAQPDVVVNSGDYLQGDPPPERVLTLVRFLLRAEDGGPLRPPHVAILGNHDYHAGEAAVDALARGLASLGVDVLLNQLRQVDHGGASVTFSGLSEEEPHFQQAVEKLLASVRPRIVLIHEPELAEHLPAGAADLVLAGHTHGGQVTLPRLERHIVRLFSGSRYVHGMYRVNEMPVYVNRGLGYSGFPIRFRARPEVAVIRLVR